MLRVRPKVVWIGYAASAFVVILLLTSPWRLPWWAQLTLTAVVLLQFRNLEVYESRVKAMTCSWLTGYMQGLDDAGAPVPPGDRPAQ
jgi:hypothetical protein